MLKNRWIRCCAWLLGCFFPVVMAIMPAVVQAESPAESPFIVDQWTQRQGLPDGEVISVIQTHDGYIWLGTLHGLVRFDGSRFTVFNQNNTPGLASDRIVYLFEDSQTNLWVGTDAGGVARVRQGKIQNFKIGATGHEGRLVSACEDADGGVWLYTADAYLARYQGGKLDVLNLHFSSSAICRKIVAEKPGPLWVGEGWVESGRNVSFLFSFRPANFHPPTLVVDQSIQAQRLDYLLASRAGGTWRLIDGHVQKWGAALLQKDWGPYPWTNATTIVTAACEDNDGNLIVGTLGEGVFWYQPDGTFRKISTAEGLSSDYVRSLCLDHEGNLWVGTDGGGLNRVKRKTFQTPAALRPFTVQSIAADNHGGLWMAFTAAGVSYLSTNSTHDYGVGRYSTAWSVLVDHRQQVWVGTWDEGLFRFQDGQFQSVPGAELLGPRIFALFEDHQGRLWAGTQNGLARWNGQDWKLFTTHDGLSENIVRAVAEDAAGNLWVGTENGGLNYFQDGKFTSYQKTDGGLPGNGVSCLYLDPDGVLWVGTSGHGLARYFKGHWTDYSTDNGLASDSISYIIEDNAGDLWIGSNAGLMRVPKKSLNDFADGATATINCRTYVETDGLPTRECTAGSQPAACRTSDGKLWFPTTKGLVEVNPAGLKPNLQPPLVRIESVVVNGDRKASRLDSANPDAITIPPGHNQLEIDFTALNFSAPDAVRFKYQMEGHETGWTTDAGNVRVAHYNELPPGQYRFRVIAYNEDGIGDKNGATLDITVQPQFWQTGWFLILVTLTVLGLIVGVVRYVSTQKLHREVQLFKQQEALEKERSRIARDLHDQLGANLTQVALLGELAEADKHLPDEIESYAQQIYHTARDTTRALDEIVWAANPSNDSLEGLANYACKYAQDYFALAGMRYRVDVPAHLPEIAIPPDIRHNAFLAFKEAVNNVVKHAQAGEAWIRLRLQPDRFILEVEDNGRGVGDVNAAKTRNGLKNMRKRMEEVRGEFIIQAGANGGTLVRLTIPLAARTAAKTD